MAAGKKRKTTVPWRQDFRDVSLLPDIKIVRTHFIFNFVAVLFLIVTSGIAVYQQYLLSVRKEAFSDLEQTVKAGNAADRRNQSDSAKFVRVIQKVETAAAFPDKIVRPEILFVEIAGLQPDEGRMKSFDFSCIRQEKNAPNFTAAVSGTMAGGKDKSAPELIGEFLDALNGDAPFWKGTEHKAELVHATPVQDANLFEYSLRLILSPEKEGETSK